MFYCEIPPPTALAGWVRTFWMLDTGPLVDQPSSFRVFAEGFAGLHFQIEEQTVNAKGRHHATAISSLQVHGQRDIYRQGTSSGISRLCIVGASLFPFALNMLFGIKANELTNRSIEASLLDKGFEQLKHQLEESTDLKERLNKLSRFLLLRREKTTMEAGPIQACIHRIIKEDGDVCLSELITQAGYSRRHFERRFRSGAGMSPKKFAQIIRFHHSIRNYDVAGESSLAALAHQCGYFDQAHFNHDFKHFSGMSPGKYFALKEGEGVADNFVQL